MTGGQRSALQRFAVAASEARRARAQVQRAERAMVEAMQEATRLGNLRLPVTARLLSGQLVTISSPRPGSKVFEAVFSLPLDAEEDER